MKIHPIIVGLLCGAMPLLYSCSNDDTPALEGPASTAISLSIASVGTGAEISRADATAPYAEAGFANENAISDAFIVIYDTPLNAATDANRGKVLKTYYLSSLTENVSANLTTLVPKYGSDQASISGNTFTVSKVYDIDLNDVQGVEKQSDYYLYALALANVGDYSSTIIAGTTTVYAMKDFIYNNKPYDDNATTGTDASLSGYAHFAMSAVNEVKFNAKPTNHVIKISGDGNASPLMVQRLASRVDITFGNITLTEADLNSTSSGAYVYDAYWDNTKYIFPIYDETAYDAAGSTHNYERIAGATFELSKIELTNVLSASFNLFEHSSGTPAILGNENWSNAGEPQNIVYSANDKNVSGIFTDAIDVTTNAAYGKIKDDSGKKYFILGYVGENTYETYDADNKYTGIKITGTVKGICSDAFDQNKDQATGHPNFSGTITYNIKHSYGTTTTNPLYYGVVRNTIYRSKVKFFAEGETVIARMYYYGENNGQFSEDDNTNGTVPYEEIKFYSLILESDGTTPND